MKFFDFLNTSVTPYHAVENISKVLLEKDFFEIKESHFNAENIKSKFFIRRMGALIAVKFPQKISEKTRFKIALAHTDFPTLKISPKPDLENANIHLLHTEVYGSPLFTSWLDRDLGYAGILAIENQGVLQTKLFKSEKCVRFPQLAVHLNRGVNQDGLKINPQKEFNALWGAQKKSFEKTLQETLAEDEKLLDFDLQLFDIQNANYGGFNDEWIYSSRLDNLSSCHSILEGIIQKETSENDFIIGAFFNNEEVGSETREGAGGNFLQSFLENLYHLTPLKNLNIPLSVILARSFAVSIDMAHALHPNFTEKHEPNHAPLLGEGIVLKMNAQKRYASDVLSTAKFKQICLQENIPFQTFIMRNDMICGSTVGPTLSAKLGIPTADIGEPMLSMHSIREMTAVKDHEFLIQFLSKWFSK